ncbi:MAG: hypothetical protein ACM3OC_10140 [Deltaproteobacteria bacterium]
MKKALIAVFVLITSSNCWAQNTTGGSWLKNMGRAALDAGVQSLNPQAKAVVDQANGLATQQQKENFLVTKAKEFLGTKNYETALELANYIKSNIDPKSASADKIIADAKAGLAKYAQDKLNQTQAPAAAQSSQAKADQVKANVNQTAADVNNLLGSFGIKK